jgi:hypothetical protein
MEPGIRSDESPRGCLMLRPPADVRWVRCERGSAEGVLLERSFPTRPAMTAQVGRLRRVRERRHVMVLDMDKTALESLLLSLSGCPLWLVVGGERGFGRDYMMLQDVGMGTKCTSRSSVGQAERSPSVYMSSLERRRGNPGNGWGLGSGSSKVFPLLSPSYPRGLTTAFMLLLRKGAHPSSIYLLSFLLGVSTLLSILPLIPEMSRAVIVTG